MCMTFQSHDSHTESTSRRNKRKVCLNKMTSILTVGMVLCGLYIRDGISFQCKHPTLRFCTCSRDNHYGGITVDCTYGRLMHIPQCLPVNTSTLILDHNHISVVKEGDLKRLTNLRSLSLQKCGIRRIAQGSLKPLKQLNVLDLSYNEALGNRNLSKALYDLNHSKIKILRVNYVTSFSSCTEAFDRNTLDLYNTDLKELYFDGNVISHIAPGAFDLFPRTIQLLSVRYTIFWDFDGKNLVGILKLNQLKTLDLTGEMQWNPASGFIRPTRLPSILLLPPNLQIVKLSNRFLELDVGNVNIIPPDVLTELFVNNNLITSITGPLTGLGSLRVVDASNNKINKLGKMIGLQNNSLQHLNLSKNELGQCLENDNSGAIFERGNYIEVLDISDNRITSLPKDIFKGLRMIKYLNISKNEIFTFQLSLHHMANLTHLDLSNNKLQLIPVNVQKTLDVLNQIVINLKDNPLACSCQSLQFLQWMEIRGDRIQGLENITCQLPNGTRAMFNDLPALITGVEHLCSSDFPLVSIIVFSIFCVVMIVVGILGYRHRWKLRYLYHVGRRGYNRVPNEDSQVDYRYDAFVSYADEDRGFVINKMIAELEEKAGLRLCIHHRDFLPGAVISENIVVSIQNSRKTVLVLSPSFLKSGWCTYEFNMAQVDGLSRKQNTVVMVLYKKAQLKDAPKDLAVMLSNNSYLEFNADLYGEIIFWQNLEEAIKTQQHLH